MFVIKQLMVPIDFNSISFPTMGPWNPKCFFYHINAKTFLETFIFQSEW